MLPEYENSLGFLIQDVARLMRLAFDRRMKDIGLTRAQWFALISLRRADGQTQQHLADQMDMNRAALSKLLSRLEAGGWIKRVPDEEDKRANRIYLADKFDDIMPAMQSEAERLMETAFGPFSEAERGALAGTLLATKKHLLGEIGDSRT